MTDIENVNQTVETEDFDLSSFGVDELPAEVEITEDLEGFAKGFPKWDLHPPKM